MTLKGVVALILRYYTKFDSFAGLLRHNGRDRPIGPAKYRLPVKFCQILPMQLLHGLFTTAKLLVKVILTNKV